VRLIAHRGFAAEAPENTLGAIRRSADRADAVEVDARRCGSGELVVIHDETVDRVTDGQGRVDEHTRDELAALSVLGSGEGVPTLDEVASAIPDGVGLLLEIKEPGIARDALAAAADVDDLLVSSFLPAALAECRWVDDDVPLALNVVESDGIAEARGLDCAAVHPHLGRCAADYVDRARAAGLDVNAWTVEDRETARELADVGVDGVIADRSDVLA